MSPRLVYVGTAVVDLVLPVPRLPTPGSDTPAGPARLVAGGGVNVMVAAARQGLPVVFGGSHGTGPLGDLVRAALAAAGVDTTGAPVPGRDTGVVVTLVEPSAERSFVTTVGAEADLAADRLAALDVRPGDLVALSGYALAHPGNAAVLLPWLAGLPTGVPVFIDPGPYGAQLPPPVRAAMFDRADWFSCNAAEARALSGRDELPAAGRWLAERTGRRAVLVRDGGAGCLVIAPGALAPGRLVADVQHVPVAPVQAVDTTGAGDVHAGALLAALAGVTAAAPGLYGAVRWANAAAALSVTRPGPDGAPTRAEVAAFLAVK